MCTRLKYNYAVRQEESVLSHCTHKSSFHEMNYKLMICPLEQTHLPVRYP